MSKTVMADSLTKDGRFFTNHVLEEINGKTRKKNSRGRKTRSTRQKGGDNVNAKDANGSTALIRASKKGQTEIVSMLLAAGADVNAKEIYGNTALIVASGNGHKEIVAILLEKGADVNIKSDFGGTALMLASLRGHTEIVAKLLEKGADVNAENNYGQTALSLASLNGHTEIVKLLRQSIAAQTLPKHLERQEDRKNLAMVMRKKDVGNRGDGTMPLELRHEIGKYLGGGKRRTRKKNSRGRKTRKKNSGGRKTPNAKRGRKLL